MNYIAHLYFSIEIEQIKTNQFDVQLRLIQAENREEALFLAKKIGINENQRFLNEQGKTVCWSFAGIPEITELSSFESGTEVAASTLTPENPNDFLKYIQLKSQDLALHISKKELIFSL